MKPKITAEEWQIIQDNSKTAKLLLEAKRFSFFRDYLEQAANEVEQIILNNRVREVHEELTITDKLKRVFVTPKKIQKDELVGQYKFINQFMDFIQDVATKKELAEKMQDENKLIIESSDEDL
jgi:antitoxin component YwqK of YwqJK toxin-antitoxin module